jgi:tetratricopeptide (TPR) repeat protein
VPVRPEPWIDPGNPEAWRRYGQALLDGGRYEDALVGFERAVELAPAGVKAWTGKAETLFGLRRYDEALAAYERAIELDPKDVDNWKGKERALLALDRHEEALAANERAVEPTPERSGDRDHQGLRPVRQPWIDPGNPEAWRRYGQALLDGGRYEDALVGFERAVELGADDVVTWRLTGHALRGLGRPEEALAAYERAIDKDPGNLDTLRLRSQILSGLGRAEEAGAAYSAEWRPVALGQPQPPTARDADIPSTAERASPSSPPPGTRVTSDLPSRPLSTGGA